MNISLHHGDFLDLACDLLVVSLFEGVEKLVGPASQVDGVLGGALADLLQRDGFRGKKGERVVFPTLGKMKARKVAVIGLGPKQRFTADVVRVTGGCIAKLAREAKAKKVITILHGAGVAGLDAKMSAEALGEGLLLGAYQFHAYHGTALKNAPKHAGAQEVIIAEMDRTKIKPATAGLERARVLAEATMLARDLVNTPSLDMTPSVLAEAARSLTVRGSGIKCSILNKEKMEKMGMGGALAVAAGSVHPPVGIHLTYTPSKRPKKRVAVVGKAVTFDSGGLNLKPEQGMAIMKCDMAGAAAVIGFFKALAVLKPAVEVHGIFLAVENMPSGSSYRPGDVVRAMNGMTIEILNTDAEGRVTLADALSYAVKKIKPDVMVDLATLTGAAIVALGDDISAVMGNDRSVVKSLLTAGKESGEELWELPLFQSYNEALSSKIADMNNTGGRPAGSIKGGLFLERFVERIPWAHVDIAGPSYIEKESRPDMPYGGTGAGVRMLVRWVEGMA